ncbi:MAG: hypothetical protein U1D30_16235 [Planctomycetota bacterium]
MPANPRWSGPAATAGAGLFLAILLVGTNRTLAEGPPSDVPLYPQERVFSPDEVRARLRSAGSKPSFQRIFEQLAKDPENLRTMLRAAQKANERIGDSEKLNKALKQIPPSARWSELARKLQQDQNLREKLLADPEIRKLAQDLAKNLPENTLNDLGSALGNFPGNQRGGGRINEPVHSREDNPAMDTPKASGERSQRDGVRPRSDQNRSKPFPNVENGAGMRAPAPPPRTMELPRPGDSKIGGMPDSPRGENPAPRVGKVDPENLPIQSEPSPDAGRLPRERGNNRGSAAGPGRVPLDGNRQPGNSSQPQTIDLRQFRNRNPLEQPRQPGQGAPASLGSAPNPFVDGRNPTGNPRLSSEPSDAMSATLLRAARSLRELGGPMEESKSLDRAIRALESQDVRELRGAAGTSVRPSAVEQPVRQLESMTQKAQRSVQSVRQWGDSATSRVRSWSRNLPTPPALPRLTIPRFNVSMPRLPSVSLPRFSIPPLPQAVPRLPQPRTAFSLTFSSWRGLRGSRHLLDVKTFVFC